MLLPMRFFERARATFEHCKLGKTTNYAATRLKLAPMSMSEALLANMADCLEHQGLHDKAVELRKQAPRA